MHKVKCKIDLGKDGWVGNSLWCKYIINDQWAKQNGQGSPTYDWKHSLFSRIKARNSTLSHLSFGILFPASPHPACVVQPSPSVILKLCSGNHLHSGKHCSEDHRLLNFQKEHFHFHCTEDQVQEQLSDQTCSSHQAEIQEKEDSKLLFRRIIRSSASKAISSPLEEQTVTSKEDNTVVDIGPSLTQRTDLEEIDKICALEISRFGAIKYGEFGLGFIKESNQLSLQKTHTRETAYMYTEWGQNFSSTSVLIRNRRTQSGQKAYVCMECGRDFTWKSNLITQQRIHSGEKPYMCKECGWGFTWKSNLFMYQRTHSGLKPYVCKECG